MRLRRAAREAIADSLRLFAAPRSARKLFASRVVVQQNANIFARLQPRLIECREPARNLDAKKPAVWQGTAGYPGHRVATRAE